MKTRQSGARPHQEQPRLEMPDAAAALSALRAWHEGSSSREAVAHFIPERRAPGESPRSVLNHIRRPPCAFAANCRREGLAWPFTGMARNIAVRWQDLDLEEGISVGLLCVLRIFHDSESPDRFRTPARGHKPCGGIPP